MRFLVYILLIGFIPSLYSQGVFIDGATVYNEGNSLIFTEGDVNITDTGKISNRGTIELTDNWVNNSTTTGLINNEPGEVNFIGFNQNISGSAVTHFYDVNLQGGFNTKSAFQDVIITNNLNLINSDLQLHQNIVHLTNPAINSLQWNSGFISGDSIGGYFARSTNSSANYQFPVGDISLNSSPYRAVDIIPTNSDSSVYGVRLAAINSDVDNTGTSITGQTGPYDRALRQNDIVIINNQYYHHIARIYGNNSARAKIHFFETDHVSPEQKYDGIVQWNPSLPQFESKLNGDVNTGVFGPVSYGSPNNEAFWTLDDFSSDIFSLASLNGILAFVPQVFSPNGDGENDILYVRGFKILSLKFIVYNRWGEKVFETTDKNIGWDGNYKGKDAQSSVYVYYLDAEVEDYGRYTQKGNVTLMR